MAICVALAGCSVAASPHLDAPAAIKQAAHAIERAAAAGAPRNAATTYQAATRKLSEAQRILNRQPTKARRLAKEAAVEAQLAEAMTRERRLRQTEKRLETAVAKIRKRLIAHGT